MCGESGKACEETPNLWKCMVAMQMHADQPQQQKQISLVA
jgi:hypothetical protein